MRISLIPILLLQMGSLFQGLWMKDLSEREVGVLHRWRLAFVPKAEEELT